ncbi:MAG: Dna2/Cas4 domain-containing protein [Chloroflexota bacterium]
MYMIIGLLFGLGIFLLWLANHQQKASGLPGGEIIYADTSFWRPVEKPLYDSNLDLSGRPDYIIRQGNQVIPVELKSTRVYKAPYDSHIFQLASYCYLVHTTYNVRPTHGILQYKNRAFRIEYTPGLESSLIALVSEMRAKGHLRNIDRSHDSAQRCQNCGFVSSCDQQLS